VPSPASEELESRASKTSLFSSYADLANCSNEDCVIVSKIVPKQVCRLEQQSRGGQSGLEVLLYHSWL
jgi:hypothetical protein